MTSAPGRRRICLVTTGHPSTNPRMVKEADALVEAGYEVRVVACKVIQWADRADAAFAGRAWWPPAWVRFGSCASPARRAWLRLRRRAALAAVSRGLGGAAVKERAMHYVVPELARSAGAVPADLYIAHNLEALPAAMHAARRHRGRLAFDAEDYHRGEFTDAEANEPTAELTRWAEERYMPACHYVTASSEGIGRAYAERLGIDAPVTVLNTFPLSDRTVPVDEAELARERDPRTVSLYWCSQTIGAGRGLEVAVEALTLLGNHVVLTLRGAWAAGYEAQLRGLAAARQVGDRLRYLPPCHSPEVVRRTGCHDIGLALESPSTINHDLCVSNKILTYLLAGVPVVATDTTGQRRLCRAFPTATRLVPPADSAALAQAVRDLCGASGARAAAWHAGSAMCWDNERARFLACVAGALGTERAVA